MKELQRPHDSFFKRLMSDERVVREFLRGFLPEELSHAIDYDTVRIVDTEKTTRSYRKYYLDLSVKCRLGQEDSLIYFVFERGDLISQRFLAAGGLPRGMGAIRQQGSV